MTVDTWLEAACADADRRGLPALKPLLETLARSTATLRRADADTGSTPGTDIPAEETRDSR